MDESLFVEPYAPRFESLGEVLIVGLCARYSFETCLGIPKQWQNFAPRIGHMPNRIGSETYGVASNFDEGGGFDYVAGVQVANFDGVPKDLTAVRVHPERYAVFVHRGHVSQLRRTHQFIWNKWLPESGLRIASTPNFERYNANFDPVKGLGLMEVFMPVPS